MGRKAAYWRLILDQEDIQTGSDLEWSGQATQNVFDLDMQGVFLEYAAQGPGSLEGLSLQCHSVVMPQA